MVSVPNGYGFDLTLAAFQPSLEEAAYWYQLGEEFASTGNFAQALRCFKEAALLDNQSVQIQLYQAVCLIHLEQPEAALDLCERLLEQDATHAQAWLFRGAALHRLGRFPEAYDSYRQALGKETVRPLLWLQRLSAFCRRRLAALWQRR